MTTYVILRNRIADEVRTVSTAAASDISTQIASEVLSAVAHYARERFYFNTKTTTFSTVANQEYYSSSDLADIATLVTIDTLRYTTNNVKLPLRERTFEEIDDSQTGAYTGPPQFFCYYKQNIRLYPIPDAVYTMTMAYLYKLTTLSADGDSNAWTTDAEELIRSRAEWKIYQSLLKDANNAALAKQCEMEALASLKRETRMRRSTKILRVDHALATPAGYNVFTDR